MSHGQGEYGRVDERPSSLQTAALAAGGTFLALGIAGFVPGIVTHYGQMTFAGGSGASLLGVFTVGILLNAVRMAIGLGVLALARTRAREALLGAGALSLVLFVYGLAASDAALSLDNADNWLHLALGVALVATPFGVRNG